MDLFLIYFFFDNFFSFHSIALDINHELNPDEMEEKERMIQQVLELQNTLDGNSDY